MPLIPDAAEAGYRALRERGLYPINHLVVVKDELLAAHPGLAADLFAAYAAAKNQYVAALAAARSPIPGQPTACTSGSRRSPAPTRCRTASRPTGR